MARYLYDRTLGRVVPAGEVHARRARERAQSRSGLSCPTVVSDACEFRSMADGQVYTSKAAYYADLRARNYEVVGNDSSLYRPRQDIELAPDPAADARLYDALVGQD